MKKHFFYLGLFFSSFLFSQNQEQKKIILSQTNIETLNSLSKQFKIKDSINDVKILNYLSLHTDLERKRIVNGFTYEIIDIVDDKPIYLTNHNTLAAASTRTSKLHNGGGLGLNLEGQGMLVGVWDGAKAHFQHQEFQNDDMPSASRVATPDTPFPAASSDAHATHVTGTISAKGIDPAAKGMAPKVNVRSYNWTNDEAEVVNEITTNGLLISNHSYGVPIYNDSGTQVAPTWMMGNYNSDARDWDNIHYNAPYYLMVASAGNSGQDSYIGGTQGGFDKLTTEKNAKNNLVVANANPTYNSTTDAVSPLSINSSSSQGPSDDGRFKPEIAGDGTNLYSSVNSSTSAYDTYSGTSMAAPNVSGTLILLQQYYNDLKSVFMRSSTLKGLVCHTALDAGIVGPDARFGYGLLDARKAVILLQNSVSSTPSSVVSEQILSQNGSFSIDVTVNNTQKLEATLCWTDPAGVAMDNQVNSTTPALVNDLDLRIIKGSEISTPWKINSNFSFPSGKGDNIVDNLEKVEVLDANGVYTIQVTHKGNLTNSSQAYSLIISGFDVVSLSNQLFDEKSLTIYPVPANDILNLSTDNEIVESYSIVDSQGRLVKESTVNSESYISIIVSDLSSGIYYLKIQGNNKSIVKKFIKK